MYMKLLLKETNIVEMVLVKHAAHVGQNTRTKSNIRFIVNTSLNIGLSVLRYVTPCN